jgi:V/A-type H+-transporting ATPase subunit C
MIPEITSLVEGASGANPLTLLALVVGILFGLVIIIVNLRLILDMAPWAYPNAKVRSMQSMLMGRRRMEELVELELMNIPATLGEFGYTETARVVAEEAGIPDIEATLNRHLLETYTKVAGFLPGDARAFFERYLKRFQVEAIKTVLRGVYAGVSPEEIEQALAEQYREELKEAAASSSVPEAVTKLESSEFGRVLSQDFEDSLLALETALDRKFYQEVMEVLLTRASPDTYMIKRLLGTEIDIINIKTVLRGARDGADVSDYLIPHGYGVSAAKLAELGSSADVEAAVSGLEGTPYYQHLYDVMDEYVASKDKGLGPFEKALDAYYVALGQAMATRQAFGLGPVLGYLVSKAVEVRNLTAVLHLKMEGFGPEEIKKVVV